MAEPARTGSVDGDARPSASDALVEQATRLLGAVVERALGKVADQASGLTERLSGVAENGGAGLMSAVTGARSMAEGKSPARSALSAGWTGLKEKVKGAFGGGGGGGGGNGGGKGLKVTNIVESIDVGVPLRLAYDQWTQFQDFSNMMKKVESVNQESDEKVNWTAKIFWSRRTWNATIIEQIPDRHIVWRSEGAKGSVGGAVTFHELSPNLTRILVVLEYTPKGLFENTGNLWRAQGRRARLELKHFRRHVMTSTLLEAEEFEGWRGEIRDSEVVKTHEEALEEEERERESEEDTDAGDTDEGDTDEGDADGEWAEDEYDEDAEDRADDGYDEDDEYDDDTDDDTDDDAADEDADEFDEDEEPAREPARAGGRRR